MRRVSSVRRKEDDPGEPGEEAGRPPLDGPLPIVLPHILPINGRIKSGSCDERMLGLTTHADRTFRGEDRQHVVFHIGLQCVEIKSKTEAQRQMVIVLHAFEMQGLPVGADLVWFPCGDEQVGAGGRDFHILGDNAGHVHDEFHRLWQIDAFEMRLTGVDRSVGRGRRVRWVGRNECMHGKRRKRGG